MTLCYRSLLILVNVVVMTTSYLLLQLGRKTPSMRPPPFPPPPPDWRLLPRGGAAGDHQGCKDICGVVKQSQEGSPWLPFPNSRVAFALSAAKVRNRNRTIRRKKTSFEEKTILWMLFVGHVFSPSPPPPATAKHTKKKRICPRGL